MKLKHKETYMLKLTGSDVKTLEQITDKIQSKEIGFVKNDFTPKQIQLAKKINQAIQNPK